MDSSPAAPRHGSPGVTRPRVGLVLGGGGITGLAYHAKRRAANAGLTEAEMDSFRGASSVTFAEPLSEDGGSDEA